MPPRLRESGGAMGVVLITGMSGVGKSTVTARLARTGHRAIDLDTPRWSEYRRRATGLEGNVEWLWKEAAVEELLASHQNGTMFVSGCASNQSLFYPRFDHVILLTASEPVIRERLATRSGNDFGKTEDELAKILSDKATFGERLTAGADVVIDTGAVPLDDVVARIEEVAEDD